MGGVQMYVHIQHSITSADSLTCFKLHPMTDLFIPTPNRLLLKAFSRAVITARRLFANALHIVMSSIIELGEL